MTIERRGPVVEQVSAMLPAALTWVDGDDARMAQLDAFIAGWHAHEAYVAASTTERRRLLGWPLDGLDGEGM